MGKDKRSFKKGDAILSEKPFAFVLKGSLNTERCDHCFKRNQLRKCSGCSFAYYCDRNCQRDGWLYHKYECSNIKKVAPRIVPDAARLLARLLIKLHTGGAHKKSFYSETKYRVFGDLMSHYTELKKDEKRVEHFISLKGVLQDYLDEQMIPNDAELLAIYGRMVINTFNILDPELKPIGSGLYLAASILDHSCCPNAVPVFDGTIIHIRTLQDIKAIDWLKVFISYTELLELPSVRQKELESCYYFLCQCRRCLDVEELGYMTSTICQNKECGRCIKGGIMETVLQCSTCNQIVSEEARNEINDSVNFTKEQLEKMGNVAYLDICRICLKKQENLLHPLNIYKVKVIDSAFLSCIDLENWEVAFDYGKQLMEPYLIITTHRITPCDVIISMGQEPHYINYDLYTNSETMPSAEGFQERYYGEFHPSRGLLLMMLGKMALLLNRVNEAKALLKEAAEVLCVTHGNDHVLVKEELFSYMRQCLE